MGKYVIFKFGYNIFLSLKCVVEYLNLHIGKSNYLTSFSVDIASDYHIKFSVNSNLLHIQKLSPKHVLYNTTYIFVTIYLLGRNLRVDTCFELYLVF